MNVEFYTRNTDETAKYLFTLTVKDAELLVSVVEKDTGIAMPGTVIDLAKLEPGHLYGIYFLDSLRWSAVFDHEDEGEPRYNYLALNYFSSANSPGWQTGTFLSIYRPKLEEDPVMINVRGAVVQSAVGDGTGCIDLQPGEKFTPILLNRHPEYAETLNHTILMLEENIRLNQLRTMGYLMPQTDLLAKILFYLIEKDPSLKSEIIALIPQYSNYKSALEGVSFLEAMGDEEALARLRNDRYRDLTVVTEYLTRRNTNTEGS